MFSQSMVFVSDIRDVVLKGFVLGIITLSLFVFTGVANAATLNVVSNPTNAGYYSTVVKAADRLVALQHADGSWDWIVTGATGPTSTIYLNIAGVTAEGLLSAYNVTGKQVYLDRAKLAGDYIVAQIDASNPKKINSYNVLFLKKLSTAINNASYATKAAEYFAILYSDTPTTLCATGCLNSAGIVAGQKAVRSWAGDPSGIVLWDLVPFVEYAKLAGDDTHAQELADAIIAEANLETYISSVTNYDLGLASALKAASLVGDSANVATLSSKITSVDNSFGTISDGKIQTTSYMVRAFKLTSDPRADASSAYLMAGVIPTGGWVDTDGNEYAEADSEAVTALAGMLPQVVQYYAIQDAVTAAVSGDTINVAPGTYAVGQIVIDKDLTMIGDVSSKPVFQPSGSFTGTTAADSWILVQSGVSFNLSNVVLDGNTAFTRYALRSHGNTTVNNVDFQKIWGSTNGIGSPYAGIAISSFGGSIPGGAGADTHGGPGGLASTLTVTNSTFSNIGRIGILVKGTGSTATITGNTYAGKGDGDFLDYAFEFGAGGSGTVSGNTVSGNRGVASDTSTSAGVLVTEYYGSGTNATITGNTFSNNSVGLHVGYLDTDASVVTAHENNFSGELVGVESDATTVTVNAENNWWGTASSTEIAVKAPGLVDFDPWYINPGKTVLSSAVSEAGVVDASTSSFDVAGTNSGEADLPSGVTDITLGDSTVLDLSSATTSAVSSVVINGNTVNLTQAVILQSGIEGEPVVLTNSNLAGVSVSIPDGTTISGPVEWDGTIMPSTDAPSDGTAPSGFTVGGTVISVGSSSGTLVFDKAVKIVLSGVTGIVGYKPALSNDWVKITTVCTGANDSSNISSGECYFTDGGNTVIWTYHFTSFGGLDPIPPTPTPTPTPAPSGGGGPVGLFGVVTNNSVGVQNAQAVVAQTPAATNAAAPATPTPRGQVLGVSTFRFTKALSVGSRGDEVTELQNRLIAEGVLSGEATGYYGSLTAQAVKAFQAKYGIAQAGVVGPQTREKLNGTSASSASEGSQFGAAVSTFARSLSQGSRGDDVTKLQERLTAEGVYTGPITGYFGALTRVAVEAYQEMKGLEKVGVVGPKTRAELNK